MQNTGWIIGLLAGVLGGAAICCAIFGPRLRSALAAATLATARSAEYAATAARLPDALARAESAEKRADQASEQLREETARVASLQADLRAANASRDEVIQARDSSLRSIEQLRQALSDTSAKLADASADRDARIRETEELRQFIVDAKAQMATVLSDVTGKLFEERGAALASRLDEAGAKSQEMLRLSLEPVVQNIEQMRQRSNELAETQARDQQQLVGAIQTMNELGQKASESTQALAKALKGNAKVRGDWGEVILETCLKTAGLVEGLNYVRQAHARDDESGRLLRPDVVIDLPDGRRIPVDAKVNLVGWAEYNEADTPDASQEALLKHTTALRLHMRDLASKNYPAALGDEAVLMTVMFVPIEGALHAALSTNADLQREAWEKRIIFASPNTLMGMLRMVEQVWQRDQLKKQIGKIVDEAGKMLDSVVGYLDSFKVVEDKVDQLHTSVVEARRKLSESNQSVLARARRMAEAGARGKKGLPEELQPIGGEAPALTLDVPGLSAE